MGVIDVIVSTFTHVVEVVNDFIWGTPAIILMTIAGILFTLLTRFFQFAHIRHWFSCTIGAIFKDKDVVQQTRDKSISQFQSLCAALAATVGTGNIVGVAGAIAVGGPGALFWMWVIAILGMMTKFSENVLGLLYRRKNEQGEWIGGPMYYLKYGFGAYPHCQKLGSVLAVLFSIFCLLASFGIGNLSQVNSMAANLNSAFNVPKMVTAIVLLGAVGMVILGGLKRIAKAAEKIVPFMVILYFSGCIYILITHIGMFPAIFKSIISSAFALKAAGGGLVGYGMAAAIQMGMKRGVFSNEAGMGSSVMIHSGSNAKEPVRQGMWGIAEVFMDTIVVCSLTGFVILSSGAVDLSTGLLSAQAIEVGSSSLTAYAFSTNFGPLGGMFVAIAIVLFAYSTVLGWNQYGVMAVEYLFGHSGIKIYQVIYVIMASLGCIFKPELAWSLSEAFNGLMMIPNLIGVISLAPVLKQCVDNYCARTFKGARIMPMLSMVPEVQRMLMNEETVSQ